MKSFKLNVLFFLLLFHKSLSVIVEIEDGQMEGTTMQSRKGINFHAFLKIPFAKPPIGDLRFQAPVENEKYNGILNATAYGPVCYQKIEYDNFEQSEDCLHLNVYTKDLQPKSLKPVIAYLHGGSYQFGSAGDSRPNYLMDRDIVFVTIGYRLNALGFLAIGTEDAVGNMGLKDQAMALKWIQKNIEKFGGDPKSVTLSGLSAGASASTAHLVSSMSNNLIHKVIAASAAITRQTGLKNDNLELTKEMAKRLNCPTDLDEMMKCLKQKNGKEIALAADFGYHQCVVRPFGPVIEPDLGQERFLKAEPSELFKNGNFLRVPILIGITAYEFADVVRNIFNNQTSLKELNENFAEFTSNCFSYTPTEKNSEILRKYYFPYDKIDGRSFDNLNQLSADGTIGYGVHRLVHYTSKFTDVYYYKFSYIGRFSIFNYPNDRPYGVHHVDDIQYTVTYRAFDGRFIKENDPENFMVERMTRIWEQFAKAGNPNNLNDEFLNEMHWPKHDNENEYYLDIGLHLIEKQGLYLKRYSIWDSLENSANNIKFVSVSMILVTFSLFLMS
ncbi:hypothetical protein PVAND_008449 [Polypedilum vanderplanki]|uniref:Carboxylic ester hydrolase n=1 Tax=Polypedilum vanderplanki TaxID=319348 RepID=A0A9J6CA16_POLVA|nr:hypothetical protein PVAND_008449 [Polypedilum vanderplanki]